MKKVYTESYRSGFAEKYQGGFALVIPVIVISTAILLAWCPWVSEDFAKARLSKFHVSPTLNYMPTYQVTNTEKVPFGRKLEKVDESFATYDFFISALGTVHILKKYQYSSQQPQQTKNTSFNNEDVQGDVETGNWKTHQSKHFSIKAPNDWEINLPEGNPNEIIDIEKNINKSTYLDIQFTYNTQPGTSAHELLKKSGDYLSTGVDSSSLYITWSEVPVEFNGKNIMANEVDFKDGHWSLFPQKSGSSGEDFQLFSNSKPGTNDRELMLQILSTFKFTE